MSPSSLKLYHPAQLINNTDLDIDIYSINDIMLGQDIIIPACTLDLNKMPLWSTQFTLQLAGTNEQNYSIKGNEVITVNCSILQGIYKQQNYLAKTELDGPVFLRENPVFMSVWVEVMSAQVVVIPSGITLTWTDITTTETDIKTDFHREIWSRPSPFWRGSFAAIATICLLLVHLLSVTLLHHL